MVDVMHRTGPVTLGLLPSVCRPRGLTTFAVNHGENTHRVDVTAAGEVKWMAGRRSHVWLALNNINFFAGMCYIPTPYTCCITA